MAKPKIVLNRSMDIPFDKLVLSEANVRQVKAGVSIEALAEDIARRGVLHGINVRPMHDENGAETGCYEIPAGGRRYRALERLVPETDEEDVGRQRGGGSAQVGRVATAHAQSRHVARDVGPVLVDDSHHPEGNPNTLDTQTVGTHVVIEDLEERIGRRRNVAQGARHRRHAITSEGQPVSARSPLAVGSDLALIDREKLIEARVQLRGNILEHRTALSVTGLSHGDGRTAHRLTLGEKRWRH